MQDTIIGVFDDADEARGAMNELVDAGIARSRIRLDAQAGDTTGSSAQSADSGNASIGHFFRSLFGMENEDDYRMQHDTYAEAMRRGSCMLSVDAENDQERDQAVAIMQRHNPIDLDKRSASWRSEGWSGYDASAPRYSEDQIRDERARRAGETTKVPIIEEQMKVGKREVDTGGVRIFKRVTEQPVHESVDLRKEHVQIERHAVDKPATEADLAAFQEGSMELRETAEEPVVSKEARIVEEVELGKQVEHEQADIDDTVRRTEVDVQQAEAGGTRREATTRTVSADSGDSGYRSHWHNVYGRSGGSYDDYDAAYRYGSQMGSSDRFRNYRWEDAEPQMRQEWESSHPESNWDRVKDAVRYGAEHPRATR